MIDGRGTAIGNGVAVGLNRLRRSTAKSKVIILLTDGDSNSGNVSPTQAAEFAKTMDVKVYAILMGQTDEARVQQGNDLFGRPLWDTGTFPVNPELLREMARTTGGEFYNVTDRAALERSFHAILDRLERSEIEDPGKVYGELFPAFLGPALFLKRACPAARLSIAPASGHVVNVEEPAYFNLITDEFLALVDSGRWRPRDPRSFNPSTMARKA